MKAYAGIFDASNHMNYALCRVAADMVGDEGLIKPFLNTKYPHLGENLYQSVTSRPDTGYPGDWERADEWARLLELEAWFEWVDFETAQMLRRIDII